MTLVIDPKVALLKGVDPVQFCVFSFIVRGDISLQEVNVLPECPSRHNLTIS